MNQDLILSSWMQPSLLSRAISHSLRHFWAFVSVLLRVLRVTVHSKEWEFVGCGSPTLARMCRLGGGVDISIWSKELHCTSHLTGIGQESPAALTPAVQGILPNWEASAMLSAHFQVRQYLALGRSQSFIRLVPVIEHFPAGPEHGPPNQRKLKARA